MGKKNDKHCILAVCRDESALRSILSIKEVIRDQLVIVSDNLRVHQLIKENEDLKIVYYNQMESLFTVAPYVLQILEAVNQWLRNLADKSDLPADLLYWVQHVEGGDTTQRIQDAVLEARSCFALFDQYKPSKVVIGATSKAYWEDDVVISCALQRNISVKRLKSYNPHRFLIDIWQKMRPVAKEIYRSVLTIDAMFRRKASGFGTQIQGKYIAIQLCSYVGKHLNHTIPLLKAFEGAGIKAVIVACDIGRDAKILRSKGYNLVELEAWIPPAKILFSWHKALKGVKLAKANFSDFLTSSESGEYAPFVRTVLMQSIRSFFLSELPYRIRLAAASNTFFGQNPPIAARLWTRILVQGVIAYRALRNAGLRPLLFWQTGWPYTYEWPYLRYDAPADIIFCMSEAHKQRLIADGQSSSQIVVSSIHWLSYVKELISRTQPKDSRAALKVSLKAKLVVFCDAQFVLGGYLTASEQFLLIKTVVEFAERYEDVCVLIKPHAGHKPGQLEESFKNRGMGRVIWIPGKDLPYNGLNASNVVLTKFSTLVAEAMILGVPSICVLMDKDMRWAIYEDAVDYALSADQLKKKLEVLRDLHYYETWVNSLRLKHKEYISRYFPEQEEDCYNVMVREVKAALSLMDKKL